MTGSGNKNERRIFTGSFELLVIYFSNDDRAFYCYFKSTFLLFLLFLFDNFFVISQKQSNNEKLD